MFEKCAHNPYMLVCKVVDYATNHKKPVRRSEAPEAVIATRWNYAGYKQQCKWRYGRAT